MILEVSTRRILIASKMRVIVWLVYTGVQMANGRRRAVMRDSSQNRILSISSRVMLSPVRS